MQRDRRVVLFCDIRDFMKLSAALGDRAPELLQEFYVLAGDAVVGRGGTLVKYIGDAVLAVFPGGREEDAVRCAIALRGSFADLAARHVPATSARLNAALASGEVVRGTFGHPSLLTEDVMGDAVAIASVLNRVPGIVVTTDVSRAAGAAFRWEQLQPLPLKWSGSTLEAWKLLE